MTGGREDKNGGRAGSGLGHHFLAAVDTEGFSKLDALEQVRTQRDVKRALGAAARRSGMDRTSWVTEPRGDGELAVLPAGADGAVLVARYPRQLATALVKVNDDRSPRPRLRLRLALHHGTLAAGELGVAGQAPIVVARLLDSDVLRRELAHRAGLDVVLIISERVFGDVVETRFLGLEPAHFVPVNVRAKGQLYRAYIHRPAGDGGPDPAARRIVSRVPVEAARKQLRRLSEGGAGTGPGARPGRAGSARPRRTPRPAS